MIYHVYFMIYNHVTFLLVHLQLFDGYLSMIPVYTLSPLVADATNGYEDCVVLALLDKMLLLNTPAD